MSNEGIRRLEASWALGIAADTGLMVVLIVVVYLRDGVVAAGVLGAVRMVPAVLSGMLSGATVERFRGERVLFAMGVIRAVAAGLCAVVIATDAPVLWLSVLAAVVAAAGAPVRPTQATLMPAMARSPQELVAANMAGLGEISLLRRSPRTATVTALTPVTAYAIACYAFVAAVSGPAAAAATERVADANLRRGAAGSGRTGAASAGGP